MQKINEYLQKILEATFVQGKKDEYSYKGTFKYSIEVIKHILDGIPINLGKDGNDGILPVRELTPDDKEHIQSFLDNIKNTTFIDFNNLIKQYLPDEYQKKNVWQMLYKGDFSGYVKGLGSKNKGNAFEEFFCEHYDDIFVHHLEKLGYISEGMFTQPISVGGDNNKRGIKFSKKGVTNNINSLDIGKIVTDVNIIDTKDPQEQPLLYLSLKYGDQVSFINMGIKTLFNKETINNPKKMSEEGQAIIDMFGLDVDQIKDVFENYETKDYVFSPKEKEVDITKLLKHNDLFESFMQNVIGYGYIFVHAENPSFTKVGYLDMREPKSMNSLIKNLKEATINYGGKGHTGKRVDINIDFSNMSVKINLRSKDGDVYPTHIMCDYTIYKYDKVLTDKDV